MTLLQQKTFLTLLSDSQGLCSDKLDLTERLTGHSQASVTLLGFHCPTFSVISQSFLRLHYRDTFRSPTDQKLYGEMYFPTAQRTMSLSGNKLPHFTNCRHCSVTCSGIPWTTLICELLFPLHTSQPNPSSAP